MLCSIDCRSMYCCLYSQLVTVLETMPKICYCLLVLNFSLCITIIQIHSGPGAEYGSECLCCGLLLLRWWADHLNAGWNPPFSSRKAHSWLTRMCCNRKLYKQFLKCGDIKPKKCAVHLAHTILRTAGHIWENKFHASMENWCFDCEMFLWISLINMVYFLSLSGL